MASSSNSSNTSNVGDELRLGELKSNINNSFMLANQMTDKIIAEIKEQGLPQQNYVISVSNYFRDIYKSMNDMKTIIDKIKTNADDNKKNQMNNELKELDEKEM